MIPSRLVIGCALEVHKTLGCGFLESVYEQALAVEFASRNLKFKRQCPIIVQYKGKIVGRFLADFVVEDCLIVELKVANRLSDIHNAQILNYLLASTHKVGLLLNFGSKSLQVQRLVNKFDEDSII